MSSDIKLIHFPLVSIGLGAFILYEGVKKINLKRKMKELSLSTIAESGIGDFVEIHGEIVAQDEETVIAPISKKVCAGFHWKIEKYFYAGAFSYWRNIDSFFSTPYLFVRDYSDGFAAIDLAHSDLIDSGYCTTIFFRDIKDDSLRTAVRNLIKHREIQTKRGMLEVTSFRITETCFVPKQGLYVLGSTYAPSYMANGKPEIGIHLSKWSRIKKMSIERYRSLVGSQNPNHVINNNEKEFYQEVENDLRKDHGLEGFKPTEESVTVVFSENFNEDNQSGFNNVKIGFRRKQTQVADIYKEFMVYLIVAGVFIGWGLFQIYEIIIGFSQGASQ